MPRFSGRTRGSIVAAGLLSLAVSPLTAQQPAAPERREHVVKAGDNLWELARTYLGNPFLWPLIYAANKQIVENPHRIFPTERLLIPPLPGEAVAAGEPRPRGPQPGTTQPVSPSGRTRFYTAPDTASIPTLISAARAAVRRVEPREYYATPWLGDSARLNVVGTVFKPADPLLERDKLTHTFHPFDRVYLSYGRTRPNVGDLLLIVSLGRRVEGYGRIIEPTGVIRVDSLKDGIMVGMVTHQFGALRTRDLAIPMDSFPDLLAEPVAAEGPEGKLIDFVVQEPLYGTTDRAFVDLGASAGVKPGDEMVAIVPLRKAEKSRAEMLPARPIAKLLVVRVTDRTATVRVTGLQEAALRTGMPVRVVRRMP
jgi:hypothetical protein